MKINHIRNATLLVEYADRKILIDPMLAEKGTYPPFPDSPRQDQNNPLEELQTTVEDIIKDVDAVIVTHLHVDHFDDAAKNVLPKDIQLFVQNEADREEVQNAGFQHVEVLTEQTVFNDIELIKTDGQHGRGEILKLAGEVCGVVFKHPEEQTLYVAGDTVWYEAVEKEIENHQPGIIVVNGGDNQFHQGGSLVMGKEDIHSVAKAAPHAKIIVVHMEAVNHWTLSRNELRDFIHQQRISSNIFVPEDGDSYCY
jgi:L-ascorbate metabolism protein UlaG (beta-lactamase superfamily)